MKRIGEDVAKKLDDPPGVVIVERPIRGKGACAQCDILGQAPVEAHIIERCSTTAAMLAQVRVAKFSYHWPQYRRKRSSSAPDLRFHAQPGAAGGLLRGRR